MFKRILLLPVVFLMTGFFINASASSEAVFKTKCAVCHGNDGSGSPAGKKIGIINFHSPESRKKSDAELKEIIFKGKGRMPAFDKKLTVEDVKGLVKYIRTLK